MTEEYTLTVPEAAAMLGETEKAVQRLIYTAKLDAIRIKGARGHEFRVRPADITTRKAELQQRIAEAQVDPAPPARGEQLAVRSDGSGEKAVPGARCPVPGGDATSQLATTEPEPKRSPLAPGTPAQPASAEAIPIGVYQELFRRYDQLGRRAAKLECENRHLRDALQRLQAPQAPPAGCAIGLGDVAPPPAEPVACAITSPHPCPAGPPARAPRQLWRSFADRFGLIGGSRQPRP
jgi:hypothetical protein